MADGDRRVWARVPFLRKVLVFFPTPTGGASPQRPLASRAQVVCHGANISNGGLCIYGRAELPVGVRVRVVLTLKGDERLCIDARVVRRGELAARRAWGLVFEQLEGRVLEQLQEYVGRKQAALQAPARPPNAPYHRGPRLPGEVPTNPRENQRIGARPVSAPRRPPPTRRARRRPASNVESLPDLAGVSQLYRRALADLDERH